MNNKLIAMLMLASLCSFNTVYAASNYSFQQTQTQPVYNISMYIVDSKEHGEVLIPAIHDCILDVDLDEQKMTIHLLPGLID